MRGRCNLSKEAATIPDPANTAQRPAPRAAPNPPTPPRPQTKAAGEIQERIHSTRLDQDPGTPEAGGQFRPYLATLLSHETLLGATKCSANPSTNLSLNSTTNSSVKPTGKTGQVAPDMVFTQEPSAHLPRLATRAGLGTISGSSEIVRFVQGGVVKTFCWANYRNPRCHCTVHLRPSEKSSRTHWRTLPTNFRYVSFCPQ